MTDWVTRSTARRSAILGFVLAAALALGASSVSAARSSGGCSNYQAASTFVNLPEAGLSSDPTCTFTVTAPAGLGSYSLVADHSVTATGQIAGSVYHHQGGVTRIARCGPADGGCTISGARLGTFGPGTDVLVYCSAYAAQLALDVRQTCSATMVRGL